MIVLTTSQKQEWNNIVQSFHNWDIYYLCEYAISLQLHGDGNPYLLYFDNDKCRLCYVVMKNDISDLKYYSEQIEKGKYFDFTTPYGYGGPLAAGDISSDNLLYFYEELNDYCRRENIITQFTRFHPLLQNQHLLKDFTKIITNKQTIYMDLQSEDTIFQNLDTKNRNMIRKAQKNGVSISYNVDTNLEVFKTIYYETMQRNSADSYYYFDDTYFNYLLQNLNSHIIVFYAQYEGKIISSSIFFYNENFMHYHLSGTFSEYRSLASTNLLLYEAALWGSRRGIGKLHLGGGIDAEDNLFGFKKQFNKNGRLDFAIGRNIFLEETYNNLIRLRQQSDPNFDINKPYLILYRS